MSYVVLAVLAIIVFALVLQPLLAARRRQEASGAPAVFLDLLAQRDALLQALRDLQLDRETGKLSEADYQMARAVFLREAAVVLSQLEALEQQLDLEVEHEIAHLRELAREARPLPGSASTSS